MLKSILKVGCVSARLPLIQAETCLAQQTRNTFILKRRWEPRLSKKGYPQRPFRPRNFVYDLVDDTNTIRKPNLNIIMTDYVKGVGYKGDLVSMRPHRAYHDFLVTGMAVYDTPENRVTYDTEARMREVRRSPFIERTIQTFEEGIVSVCMNKFKPWIIEPWHIRAAMRKASFIVANDSQIELPKTPITGPDMAKQHKDFFVTITINNLEKARVRCRLHHMTLDPKLGEPYTQFDEEEELDLLFPDDETQKPIEHLSTK